MYQNKVSRCRIIENILDNNIKDKSNTKSKSHRINGKGLLYAGGVLLLTLLVVYMALSFYYYKHFFYNTTINSVKISNMTVNQVENAVNEQAETYSLTLEERNDESEQIMGKDIGLHIEFDGELAALLEKQNGFAWPLTLFKSQDLTLNTMTEYDEALLQTQFDKLNCFNEENAIDPVNASLSEYGANGYEIVPESQGTLVKKDKLFEVIEKSILSLEPTISLEKEGCYEEPQITSDSADLKKAMDEMNKVAGAEITYQFGDKTEVLKGDQINKWLSVDDEFNVKLDTDGIKEFVDYIGKTYNTFGKVRTFKTSYGNELQISGGDYGWWLDRATEVSDLTELIKNGEKITREPAYFQTAQQYGDDDIGSTYVEVNLSAQHLFFYKDGSLLVDADIVSGNVSKNYGTPVGTYPIQYTQNNATLVGEDYSTPVSYWMPFNKNIGLHDASWRGSFGKDIYLTRGSHGCINMPPTAAKTVFENVKRGIPVIVYQLPGTENYDTSKYNNAANGTQTPGTATDGTQTPGTQTPGTTTDGTQTPGTTTDGSQTTGTTTDGTQTSGTTTDGAQTTTGVTQ